LNGTQVLIAVAYGAVSLAAVARVTRGKGGMPSFKGQLSPKQIQDVAAYVSSSAGKR
jgi:mono/diheme cytochrome c family protein